MVVVGLEYTYVHVPVYVAAKSIILLIFRSELNWEC